MLFTYKGIEYKLILLTLAGSQSYNTNFRKGEGHPYGEDYESDIDLKGVYIVNNVDRLGVFNPEIREDIQSEKIEDRPDKEDLIKQLNTHLNLPFEIPLDNDIALYSLNKFIKMASDNNPNILDILFVDEEIVLYKQNEWEMLRNERNLFLTTKVKKTFSEFGKAQIYKMNSHYKMFNEFPQVNEVTKIVEKAFYNGDITFQWINDNFSGDLTKLIVQKVVSQHLIKNNLEFDKDTKQYKEIYFSIKNELETISKKSISWDKFLEKYISEDLKQTIYNYRKPYLIDFITFKDLKGHKYDKKTTIQELLETLELKNISFDLDLTDFNHNDNIYNFLLKEASFRTIGESVINIFTKPLGKFNGGILGQNGDLKANDPKETGKFVGSAIINKNDYKKQIDNIKKLWFWKSERNEFRSILEEKFGYDTKNGGHLIRLLTVAIKIFKTGTYIPKLNNEDSIFIKNIIKGHFTYNELMELADKLEIDLENISRENKLLPNEIDKNKINDIYLSIILNKM